MEAWLIKLLVYGCLGVLIENLFTGGSALIIHKDWRAPTRSYLYMPLIYGSAGLALEYLHKTLNLHPFFAAFIYVPVIYIFEFVSAFILKALIKKVPWDYSPSKWSPLGFVQFKYIPFWFGLALVFDPICGALTKIMALVARYY